MIRKFLRLLPYAAPQWRRLAVVGVLTLLGTAFAVVGPWPLKLLVDYALGAAGSEEPSAWLATLAGLPAGTLVAMAACAALLVGMGAIVLDAGLTWAWSVVGQRTTMSVATDIFDNLQRLSLRFHSRGRVGDALQRITTDAHSVHKTIQTVLVNTFQRPLLLVSIAVVAWQLDRVLTLVMLGAAPALAGAGLYFGGRIRQRSRQAREARSRLISFVQQTFAALPVVQAFTAERRNRQHFDTLADGVVREARKGAVTGDVYKLVNGITTSVAVAGVLLLGGRQVLHGVMTVGTLLVFIQYSRKLLEACRQLLEQYGRLRAAEAGVDRVLEILDSDQRIVEDPNPLPLPPAGVAGSRIDLREITFGYETDVPVLCELDLTIEPGETVAIVGRSSSGKTTLASMIPRFVDPWEGQVLIDGVDVRRVGLADLRRRVALVLQEPLLMPLTIAQNIAYGRPEATPEEVRAAAVASAAARFIEKLPDGYLTMVGAQGATLSGGERQRITIARALLSRASIIIMDEPTAALDSESELAVLDALDRLAPGRTTLLIAHRLTTACRADRIIVMDEGRIVEEGSHQELLAAPRGIYRELWQLHTSRLEVGAQ